MSSVRMGRIPEAQRLHRLTELERGYWKRPGIVLAGMDEVGRGPLAGPVVVGCVVMPDAPLVEYVNDSKKLSPLKRERVYEDIRANARGYALGWVSNEQIDEDGIIPALHSAFVTAFRGVGLPITDVLVDAVKGLPLPARQYPLVHGDSLSYLIAAASIIAKVERDRYMVQMDAVYPQYGFKAHKGYGTAAHIAAIREYGPCPLHRRSFLKKYLGAEHG